MGNMIESIPKVPLSPWGDERSAKCICIYTYVHISYLPFKNLYI